VNDKRKIDSYDLNAILNLPLECRMRREQFSARNQIYELCLISRTPSLAQQARIFQLQVLFRLLTEDIKWGSTSNDSRNWLFEPIRIAIQSGSGDQELAGLSSSRCLV